jgi:predicted GNAT family acetyltransferase
MNVTRFPDASTFLAATAALRAQEPVLTNVIGTIARGVVDGRHYDSEQWLGVLEGSGNLVGCAVRTAPWNLTLSPMPEQAARALGAYLSTNDPGVPGVSGPRSAVEALVGGLTIPVRPRIVMVDVVRVLHDLTPLSRPVRGGPRRAGPGDLALLLDWHVQFAIDARLPAHDPQGMVESRLSGEGFWLWEVDGEPVSMASSAPLVATPAGAVGRVGPVYTPAAQRGNGFGTAVTRRVVEGLTPRCTIVMLYADAANPASNGVYERLGFRIVAEVVEMTLR